MATFNLFNNSVEISEAVSGAYEFLRDQNGHTGSFVLKGGGFAEHLSCDGLGVNGEGQVTGSLEVSNGITGRGESYIERLNGGIRVNGDSLLTGDLSITGSFSVNGSGLSEFGGGSGGGGDGFHPMSFFKADEAGLFVGSGEGTGLILGTGNALDGYVLTIDTSSETGIKWAASAAGLSGFQGSYGTYTKLGGGTFGQSILEPFSSALSNTSINLNPLGSGAFSIGEGFDSARGNYAVDLQIPAGSNGNVGSGTALGHFSALIGGSGNHAAANYSIIGGGILNSIDEATDDRLNSLYSFIGAGAQNHIKDSKNSAIVGGYGNQILGENTPVSGNYVIGNGNAMTDISNAIVIGHNCSVNADYSMAIGIDAGTSRYGEIAFAGGKFSLDGDAKSSILVSRNSTTNANQTDLYLDGSSNRITVNTNRACYFETDIVAKQDAAGGGDSAAYKIQGLIKNHGGTTSFVGSPTVTTIAEDDATWSVTATAAGNRLELKVTGAAATNIRWVATTKLTEVYYA